MDVSKAQSYLQKAGIDGWLLYDFHGLNPLARQLLKIPADAHLTRRFFYWIPAKGEPIKIRHQIEPHALRDLPGKESVYLSWQSLEDALREALEGSHRVAMEYSPKGNIPTISKVDGGTIDLIRSLGKEVVSSGAFLAYFTSIWDEAKWQSHRRAAAFIETVVEETWDRLKEALKKGKTLTEYELQQGILKRIAEGGMTTDWAPICAVNAHAADPHYSPTKEKNSPVSRGDLLLLDLGCKEKQPGAVYVDITRMAVADEKPSPQAAQLFDIVKRARDQALGFIQKRLSEKKEIKGYEVDQVCRQVVEEAGFGSYFIHRTGHNIGEQTHGPGANLDSLETWDDRPLLACTCFSIEPGIYIPGQIGIRLECDVYLTADGKALVTGPLQEEIIALAD